MTGRSRAEALAQRRAALVAEAAMQRLAFVEARRRAVDASPIGLLEALPYVDSAWRIARMVQAHPWLAIMALARAAWKRFKPGR